MSGPGSPRGGEGMDWLDRLLAGDDLDDAGQRELEERLLDAPAARELLERVRGLEKAPGPRGALPELDTLRVSAAHAQEAERSLRTLLLRVLDEVPARAPESGRLGWRHRLAGWLRPPVLVPAAVVALAAFFFFRSPDPALGPLQIEGVALTRGADAPGWREGDAFRLRCDVTRPMVPVVFHLDPEGRLALLHPATPAGPFPRSTPARPIVLPDPAGPERWELTGAGGRETFLLAAWKDPPADLAQLVAELEKIPAGAPDASAAVVLVREALERVADEVRVAVIDR